MKGSKIPGDIKDSLVTINHRQLKLSKLIGEGAYSYVYYSYDIADKKEYAIKQVRTYTDSKYEKILKNELQALEKLLTCEYIVKFYGHIRHSSGCDLIALEYCPISLFSYLEKRLDVPLEDFQILKIFAQVTTAIDYMHTLNPPLINFDLKIDNLLLSKINTIRLCDFGSVSSEVIRPNVDWNHNTRCSVESSLLEITSPQYRAPEILDLYLNFEIGTKVDIWALGCIGYFLSYFKYPFDDGARLAILNNRYKLLNASPFINNSFSAIIKDIFVLDPTKRPTAAQILKKAEELGESIGTHLHGSVFPVKSTSMEDVLKQNTQVVIENVVTRATNIIGSIKEAGNRIKFQINQKGKQDKSFKPITFFTGRIAIIPCPNLLITRSDDNSPSSTRKSLSAEKLAGYLDSAYPSSYLLVNLINSALYPVTLFHNSVSTYNMSLHQVPDLSLAVDVVKNCLRYLAGDQRRILVIHCTDGGYLSYYFATLLLVFSKAALDFKYVFNKILSTRPKIVISCCHFSFLRLAGYIELFSNNPGYIVKNDPIYIESVAICPVFLVNKNKTCCRPFITISIDGNLVFSSAKDPNYLRQFDANDKQILIPLNVSLLGNILISVYHVSRLKSQLVQKKIFSVYFHTGFIDNSRVLTFPGHELDISSPILFNMLKNVSLVLNLSSPMGGAISMSVEPFKLSIQSVQPHICFENPQECTKFIQRLDETVKFADLKDIRIKSMSNIFESKKKDKTKVNTTIIGEDEMIVQPNFSESVSLSDEISPSSIKATKGVKTTPTDQPNLIDFPSNDDDLFGIFTKPGPEEGTKSISSPPYSNVDPFSDNFSVKSLNITSTVTTNTTQSSTKPNTFSLTEDIFTMKGQANQFLPNNDLFKTPDSNIPKTLSSQNLLAGVSAENKLDFDSIFISDKNRPQALPKKTESETVLGSIPKTIPTQAQSKPSAPSSFQWSKPGATYQQSGFMSSSMNSNSSQKATTNNKSSVSTSNIISNDPFADLLSQTGFGSAYNSQANSGASATKTTLNDARKLQDENSVQNPVKKAVKDWSEGKQKNIRTLLSTLHLILWSSDKWTPLTLSELSNADQIKTMYYKACRFIHPDKNAGTQNEELAKYIFMELNESWKAFEASGMKVYN